MDRSPPHVQHARQPALTEKCGPAHRHRHQRRGTCADRGRHGHRDRLHGVQQDGRHQRGIGGGRPGRRKHRDRERGAHDERASTDQERATRTLAMGDPANSARAAVHTHTGLPRSLSMGRTTTGALIACGYSEHTSPPHRGSARHAIRPCRAATSAPHQRSTGVTAPHAPSTKRISRAQERSYTTLTRSWGGPRTGILPR